MATCKNYNLIFKTRFYSLDDNMNNVPTCTKDHGNQGKTNLKKVSTHNHVIMYMFIFIGGLQLM